MAGTTKDARVRADVLLARAIDGLSGPTRMIDGAPVYVALDWLPVSKHKSVVVQNALHRHLVKRTAGMTSRSRGRSGGAQCPSHLTLFGYQTTGSQSRQLINDIRKQIELWQNRLLSEVPILARTIPSDMYFAEEAQRRNNMNNVILQLENLQAGETDVCVTGEQEKRAKEVADNTLQNKAREDLINRIYNTFSGGWLFRSYNTPSDTWADLTRQKDDALFMAQANPFLRANLERAWNQLVSINTQKFAQPSWANSQNDAIQASVPEETKPALLEVRRLIWESKRTLPSGPAQQLVSIVPRVEVVAPAVTFDPNRGFTGYAPPTQTQTTVAVAPSAPGPTYMPSQLTIQPTSYSPSPLVVSDTTARPAPLTTATPFIPASGNFATFGFPSMAPPQPAQGYPWSSATQPVSAPASTAPAPSTAAFLQGIPPEIAAELSSSLQALDQQLLSETKQTQQLSADAIQRQQQLEQQALARERQAFETQQQQYQKAQLAAQVEAQRQQQEYLRQQTKAREQEAERQLLQQQRERDYQNQLLMQTQWLRQQQQQQQYQQLQQQQSGLWPGPPASGVFPSSIPTAPSLMMDTAPVPIAAPTATTPPLPAAVTPSPPVVTSGPVPSVNIPQVTLPPFPTLLPPPPLPPSFAFAPTPVNSEVLYLTGQPPNKIVYIDQTPPPSPPPTTAVVATYPSYPSYPLTSSSSSSATSTAAAQTSAASQPVSAPAAPSFASPTQSTFEIPPFSLTAPPVAGELPTSVLNTLPNVSATLDLSPEIQARFR